MEVYVIYINNVKRMECLNYFVAMNNVNTYRKLYGENNVRLEIKKEGVYK